MKSTEAINHYASSLKKEYQTGSATEHSYRGYLKDLVESLDENSLKSLPFEKVEYQEPLFYFVKKDFKLQSEYENAFNVTDLFPVNGSGMVTKRDSLAYQFSKHQTEEIINNIYNLSCQDIKEKYNQVSWESRDGKVEYCKDSIVKTGIKKELFIQSNYRPFDYRWTYYTGISKGFIGWPVNHVMQHFIKGENIGLVVSRQCVSDWRYIFLTKLIGEFNLTGSAGSFGSGYYFPLYLYSEKDSLEDKRRTPNLDQKIVSQIEKALNLEFVLEKEENETTFAPIDILDYIYAILHSPSYREKYKEFLKIDFPRVPFPDAKSFWTYVKLGSELRSFHLLENPKIYEIVIELNESENNTIERKIVKKDSEIKDDVVTIWLNDEQYITNIPLIAWEFYIGGYQPAQKWLKDRQGRVMGETDYEHYNKIIVSLMNTHRIMQEIDEI